MQKILDHLKIHDPKLHAYAIKIKWQRELKADHPQNYFYRLTYDIVGQQLSGKVVEVIFNRFLNLFPAKRVSPETVLALSHEELRGVGMSNAKAKYVKNLAEAAKSGQLLFEKYGEMDNEAIIANLVTVKGIGRWTAEMFLMFTMARPDVFSFGDLGLKNGLKKIYGLTDFKDTKKIECIVNQWAPYRTYACLILWASLDD